MNLTLHMIYNVGWNGLVGNCANPVALIKRSGVRFPAVTIHNGPRQASYPCRLFIENIMTSVTLRLV